MSRKRNQQTRCLWQRAGRHQATKSQASVYFQLTREAAEQHVGDLFPNRGSRSARKMSKLVQRFGR